MNAPGRTSTLPWLALGLALAGLASLLLFFLSVAGPWPAVAGAALAATALCCGILGYRLRDLTYDSEAIEARAAMAESERDSLQRDLLRHDRLEQELMLAKQAAESAVLAKGEFLATMSHEIRTPLNGIVPMLDLLSRAALAPDHREMLNTASASSQQLLRIVDDILDYSKLEANKLELEVTGFNLREVLDGVIQLMQRPAENKNLRLELKLDPAVRLPVRGDPVRVRQVLSNLIGNAVKFTERGLVSIKVRRMGETHTQHLLRFEVRDTGIGIDAEAQSRLFNSFSQADASTTRLYGGTGLGLAICKRIVDLMGGRIGVVSELGRGAMFWFEVPLLKVIGDLRSTQAMEQTRVLLVSPDPRLGQRLTMLLPTWGMHLATVETTQEALERIRAGQASGGTPYSVIIGDHAGIRGSARALHRGVARTAAVGTRMVWLYGDEVVPDELRDGTTLLPRQSHGTDLRSALSPSEESEEGSTLAFESLPETGAETYHDMFPIAPLPDPHLPDATAGVDDQVPLPSLETQLLLVEDNPVNMAVGQKLLSVLGYTCDTAINGQLALEKLAAGHYSLVLMDCQMPVQDGYSATREWRERERLAGGGRVPIVAMTANAMAGDRQRCLDAGMDDYLSKPVSREQLQKCLQRWLPGRAVFAERAADPVAPVRVVEVAEPPHALPANPPRATSSSGFPVLDHDMLDELQEIAGAETARIIALFLEDAPRLISQLETAATVPDLDAMREASHTLKSSSANVGAMALSAAAKRVELGARAYNLDRPAVAVALVIAEYARARMALQGYVMELDRAGRRPAQSSSFVSR